MAVFSFVESFLLKALAALTVYFFKSFFKSLTVDEESKKSNVMLLNEGGGVCLMWFQLGHKEFSIILLFFLVA